MTSKIKLQTTSEYEQLSIYPQHVQDAVHAASLTAHTLTTMFADSGTWKEGLTFGEWLQTEFPEHKHDAVPDIPATHPVIIKTEWELLDEGRIPLEREAAVGSGVLAVSLMNNQTTI